MPASDIPRSEREGTSTNISSHVLGDMHTKRDSLDSRLRNLTLIYEEMTGKNKGLFMDDERLGIQALVTKTKEELQSAQEELLERMRFYEVEVKGMEQIVNKRYTLLNDLDNLLSQTPDCAQVLAIGQLDLEDELDRRRRMLNSDVFHKNEYEN